MSATAEQLEQRPKLSRAARLRYDAPTRSYVLLAPERGLRLNDSASEIVQRCTGEFTVKEIAAEMLSACRVGSCGSTEDRSAAAPTAEEVTKDILELLVELRRRQLLFFDSVL